MWLGVVSAVVIAVNSADGFIRLRDTEPADRRGIIVAMSVRSVIDVAVACAVTSLVHLMVH